MSLDADDWLEQLSELAALDARLLVAPLGVDRPLDVLHVWGGAIQHYKVTK